MAPGGYQRRRVSDRPLSSAHAPRALRAQLDGFGTTIFTEMTRLANEHGAINLSQGFPDFDGPDFAKEAAIAAIRGGARPVRAHDAGSPRSTRRSRRSTGATGGSTTPPDTEITVTSGATEAIFAAIQGVCDAGDEVILFEPYYDSYKASVRDGGRRAARRDAARARTGRFDPRRARGRVHRPRPARSSSTRRTTRPARSSRRDELEMLARALPGARRPLHHRRGLRAPRLRGRATSRWRRCPGMRERTITISSLRQDVLADGLEDRLGGGAAGADGRRARGPPVHHLRHGHAAAARRGRRRSPAGPEYYAALARRLPARRDYLVAGALPASASRVRPPRARTSSAPTSGRSASTTTAPSSAT